MHDFKTQLPNGLKLFESNSEWKGTGTFYNNRISPKKATSLMRIFQHNGLWILENSIQVRVPELKVLTAVVEILPITEAETSTLIWTHIPNIGKVTGSMMMAGAALMGHYHSPEYEIEGMCTFIMEEEGFVRGFGHLNKAGKNKGTWSLALSKVEPET